jgi:hypothetical protein
MLFRQSELEKLDAAEFQQAGKDESPIHFGDCLIVIERHPQTFSSHHGLVEEAGE